MIKPIKTAGIALLLGVIVLPSAQAQTPAQNANAEVVRRQAAIIELKKELDEAKNVEDTGNHREAAKLYEKAWERVESIGFKAKGIDVESAATLEGLTRVRLALANRYANNGNLTEARKELKRILVLSPNNFVARGQLQSIDAQIEKLRGRMPSEETIGGIKDVIEEKTQAATLVQDGKLLYEMARYDQAEAKLKQALKIDPVNRGAGHYMVLVQEAKNNIQVKKRDMTSREAIKNVTKEWVAPTSHEGLQVPNELANLSNTNNFPTKIYTGPGRARIHRILHNIQLERFPVTGTADNLSLRDIITDLTVLIDGIVPEGINIIVDQNTGQIQQSGFGGDPSQGGFDPNDPFGGGGFPQAQEDAEVDIAQEVTITIDPALRNITLHQLFEIIMKLSNIPIKYSVEDWGIMFSHAPAEGPRLETRTYRVDPDTFIQGLQSVGVGYVSADSGQGGGGQGGGGGGGQGGGGGGFGGGGQGGQGGGIGGSASAAFAEGGLAGVTRTTSALEIQVLVREFFTACGVDLGQANVPQGGQGGGLGGGGFGGDQGGQGGTSQKALFFNDRLGLLFVRATRQDLDIIDEAIKILNATTPQIQIEAKFTEFSQNDSKAIGFDWILGNWVMPGGKIGVSAGSAPSFNDGKGGLFPGVGPEGGAAAGGAAAGGVGGGVGQGGGAGQGNALYGYSPTVMLPAETDGLLTSSLRQAVGKNPSIPTLGTITGILTNPQFRVIIRALEQRDGVDLLSAPKVTTLSGRQTQITVMDLKSIATSSQGGGGQPIEVPQVSVVSSQGGGSFGQGGGGQGGGQGGGGFGGGQGGGGGGFGGGGQGGGGFGGGQGGGLGGLLGGAGFGSAAQNYQTTTMPFGTTLDVIPYVASDGYTIHMTVIPKITEFLGYEDAPFQNQVIAGVGNTVSGALQQPLALPSIRVRYITSTVHVWDGQTLVLGGLIAENVVKVKDKVPMLGDLPFIGRLFRSERSHTEKKNLMIFVSPRIIDPAGNPVHTQDDWPYNRGNIPAQQPALEQAWN
ncbi:MAG: type II secretory pathway component GspD/PulD (secretin)/tetratricopeptide (TPR) repeat protein [Limisphaerales bacterium]|jgi:type II secretory pathway component GspD/PulD (secretin)/tetratricopeptide (TPR) repeat protein